jgi:pyruvate/2-oxoglutarate dehydrogenase complex dihydrolipoamide acyltransferase (E2) component
MSNLHYKCPDFGEGLNEAKLQECYVVPGEEVKKNTPILLLETDKSLIEVPCPFDATIETIHFKQGDLLKKGDVLITFAQQDIPVKTIPAMPAARMLAKKHHIDLKDVQTKANRPISLDDIQAKIDFNQEHSKPSFIPITLCSVHDQVDYHKTDEAEDICSFFIQSLAAAIAIHPKLNAYFNPKTKKLTPQSSIHLALAVAYDNKVYTPIISFVEKQSLAYIREQINQHKKNPKEKTSSVNLNNKIKATLTYSNIGPFAGRYANAMLSEPSIMTVVTGSLYTELKLTKNKELLQITKLPMSITYHQEAISGIEVLNFLKTLKKIIETQNKSVDFI